MEKCKVCGKEPKIEYVPGQMLWRVSCPAVGCVNHRFDFPLASSIDGVINVWRKYQKCQTNKKKGED